MSDDDERCVYMDDFAERVSSFFDDHFGATANTVKVTHATEAGPMPGCKVSFESSAAVPVRLPTSASILSPEVDEAEGQMELGCEVDIPGLCSFTQTLTFSTDSIATEVEVSGLAEGTVVKGTAAVGASSDESAGMELSYKKDDFYGKGCVVRGVNGKVETAVEIGAIWGLLTGGVAYRRPSSDEASEVSYGLGFQQSANFVFSGYVKQEAAVWSSACVSAVHSGGGGSDGVQAAAKYELDLTSSLPPTVTVGSTFSPFKEKLWWKPKVSLMAATTGLFGTSLAFQLNPSVRMLTTATWDYGTNPSPIPQVGFLFSSDSAESTESSE